MKNEQRVMKKVFQRGKMVKTNRKELIEFLAVMYGNSYYEYRRANGYSISEEETICREVALIQKFVMEELSVLRLEDTMVDELFKKNYFSDSERIISPGDEFYQRMFKYTQMSVHPGNLWTESILIIGNSRVTII